VKKLKNEKVKRLLFSVTLFIGMTAPSLFAQSTLPAPKQENLLNGLKILMWPDAKTNKVELKLRIHSGSAFDPQGKEGLMQMLADNLFPNESTREFFLEDLGGELEVITNYDYIQINASSKPESLLTMLETVSTAVSNTSIDKETTAKLRAALLAKVTSLESDPSYVADQAVAKRLFGNFPYGRPLYGTADSLKKIEMSDMLDAKQRFFNADNATITLAGNFDKSTAFRALRRYLGGWSKADKKIPATFRQPDSPDTTPLQIEIAGTKKSIWALARSAPARNARDFYPMLVTSLIWQDQHCPFEGNYHAHLLRGIVMATTETNFVDLPVSNVSCPFLRDKKTGKSIYSEIRSDDFESAKIKMIASLQKQLSSTTGLANLWLDVDTYHLSSLDDELKKATSVSLGDVKTLVEKLSNTLTVQINVNPPLQAN
jgi:predicted Zn-dependent peptidase